MSMHTSSPASRLLFLDALRALASMMILWHHFALYPPLCAQATPILGGLVHWFHEYARCTQVFFVVGGYLMARTMTSRTWDSLAVWRFLARRYCRLGIPYLAAIALAIAACSFGHGWVPDAVIGAPPTVPQMIAHVFFLQELLGYEHFSAGIWFVCMNFQLGIIHVFTLWLRDALADRLKISATSPWIDVPSIAGWLLSLFALFHFHDQPGADSLAPYFYPYFFLGVITHHATINRRYEIMFWIYLTVIILRYVSRLALAPGHSSRRWAIVVLHGENRVRRALAAGAVDFPNWARVIQPVPRAFPGAGLHFERVDASRLELAKCGGGRAARRIYRECRNGLCFPSFR
jgi:peptidoglycan/LPS O-acetylase OafA/YrhL